MNSERTDRERAERRRHNGSHTRPGEPAGSQPSATSDELESLPLEAALEELDRIVATLEDGRLSLDDSLALYERGMRLTQRCQQMIDTAELRVQRLRPAAEDAAPGRGYILEEFEADED